MLLSELYHNTNKSHSTSTLYQEFDENSKELFHHFEQGTEYEYIQNALETNTIRPETIIEIAEEIDIGVMAKKFKSSMITFAPRNVSMSKEYQDQLRYKQLLEVQETLCFTNQYLVQEEPPEQQQQQQQQPTLDQQSAQLQKPTIPIMCTTDDYWNELESITLLMHTTGRVPDWIQALDLVVSDVWEFYKQTIRRLRKKQV